MYIVGVFLHFTSDMQKYVHLKLNPGKLINMVKKVGSKLDILMSAPGRVKATLLFEKIIEQNKRISMISFVFIELIN